MKESSFRLLSFSLKTLIDGYRMTVITEQTGQENLSLVGWGILYARLCWYKSLMILYSHGLYLLWFHLSKQSPGSVLSMTATSERASHSLTLRGADRTVIMASCLQLSSERHSPQVFLVPATSTDLTWPSAAPRFALKSGNGRGPHVRHGVQWGRNWAGRWHLSPLHESEATSYLAGSRQGRKVHTEQTMLPCLPALQCVKNQMGPLPIVCFKKHMCSLIWCPGWPKVQFWTYTVFINI